MEVRRRAHHMAGKPDSPSTKSVCPTFVLMFSIPGESKASSTKRVDTLNPIYPYAVY